MSIQEQLPLSLSVLPEYLHHLRSLPPVPRKIHYSWQDPARLLNSSTEIVRRGVRAAIETNPGWDVRIYDDAQMDRIIRSSTLVSASDWTILEREHPVAKVDLLRLILMYEQGGLYSDVDRLFNRDLNQIFGRGTRLLLPTHFDTDFSQDLMATSPGNRLFKNAVELNLARRRSMRHNARGAISGADLLHLGPISYSHAVLTSLFGVSVDRPAMGHAMQRIRAALANTEGLIAAPRETKCHTAVYAGPDATGGCSKWLDKTALHAEFRRRAWTEEIRSAWGSGPRSAAARGGAGALLGGHARAAGRTKARGKAAWGDNQGTQTRAPRRRAHGPAAAAAAAAARAGRHHSASSGLAEQITSRHGGDRDHISSAAVELPLLYSVGVDASVGRAMHTHARRRPRYRVRLAGAALVVAPVRRLQAAICRSDASPAEVYPILRNSSVAGMRAGVPWCVGHVATLTVPVAGRYFVEALTLFDDYALERYEQHCSALRPGAPALLTATVELDRSAAAPPGGGAYLFEPTAAAPRPRAVRTRVQDSARCPASRATLAQDARGAAQHAPGYRWAAISGDAVSGDAGGDPREARATPLPPGSLPPGSCVVGDSQGRNLCLPGCTTHSPECEAVVRAPRDACRFFRANYPLEAECSAWNGEWAGRSGVPLQGCRQVLLSFGQWSMRFRRRNALPLQQQLGNFSKALARLAASLRAGGRGDNQGTPATTVWLLSTLEIPPGCLVTSCPAATFQTPPLTRAYNVAIERASRQAGVGFISLDEASRPLWDAAADWSHADARAVTAMRSVVATRIVTAAASKETSAAREASEALAASVGTLRAARRREGRAWRRGAAKGRGRGPKPNAFC